jgi:hypothetical protein
VIEWRSIERKTKMTKTTRLNAEGFKTLAATLKKHGRGGDSVAAWADEIDAALANREQGESLSIELNGVKDCFGNLVFFNPSEDEVQFD